MSRGRSARWSSGPCPRIPNGATPPPPRWRRPPAPPRPTPPPPGPAAPAVAALSPGFEGRDEIFALGTSAFPLLALSAGDGDPGPGTLTNLEPIRPERRRHPVRMLVGAGAAILLLATVTAMALMLRPTSANSTQRFEPQAPGGRPTISIRPSAVTPSSNDGFSGAGNGIPARDRPSGAPTASPSGTASPSPSGGPVGSPSGQATAQPTPTPTDTSPTGTPPTTEPAPTPTDTVPPGG
jgi:hypothetical protein